MDIWITLTVVAAVIVLLVRERFPPDLVMFGGLAFLVVAGVLHPGDALLGFSSTATATIAVLFLVAEAVHETGAIRVVSRFLFGDGRHPRVALARLILPTSFFSAFLNNTPIVAMLIPAVRDFARRIGQSPGRFLMALSFATILGGTCTLIGTSTNLVVSGLLERMGHPPLGMFELTAVGLPMALAGIAYLLTVGDRLSRPRPGVVQAAHDEVREYLAEVEVESGSPLAGKTVKQAGLRHLPGLFLVEIRRDGRSVHRPVTPEDRLAGGDHLVFSGRPSTVQDLRAFPGLRPLGEASFSEGLDRNLYEVVLSNDSSLVGTTVRDAEFRRRYEAAVLAVHRAGERIDQKIGDIVLRPGDTLMLTAAPGFYRAWRDSADFYLVSEVDGAPPPRYRQAPIAVGAMAAIVLLPAALDVDILVVALGALIVLLGTGTLSPRAVRRALNIPVLVMVATSFGLARGIEVSGAAALLAGWLDAALGEMGPTAMLAGVYVVTAVLTNLVTNTAAAALVLPVALSAADAADLDPRAYAIAVALAASAAFSTPIGYQTNLMVYGPGGYRFGDFVRVGLPLNVVGLVVAVLVIPWWWGL